MKGLLVIVGPTAIGKSRLALELARHLSGEIVNADSRQVYRYMDIGTAKPSPEEQALVPHHLIDIVDPDADFNLAFYLDLVRPTIDEIRSRGRLPILVGGSGQYIWAVVEGWQVPRVPPDHELRKKLTQRAREEGIERLYEELRQRDPEAASRIDPRNIRRVIRALEVCLQCGSFSRSRGKTPPQFPLLIIGLTAPREELYRRIDLRVEEMIKRGWVAEVKNLLAMGFGPELPSLSSLGYRELVAHINGRLSLEAAVQRTKWETHRFARHQYAWFRHNDPRINWFDITTKPLKAIVAEVTEMLRREGVYGEDCPVGAAYGATI